MGAGELLAGGAAGGACGAASTWRLAIGALREETAVGGAAGGCRATRVLATDWPRDEVAAGGGDTDEPAATEFAAGGVGAEGVAATDVGAAAGGGDSAGVGSDDCEVDDGGSAEADSSEFGDDACVTWGVVCTGKGTGGGGTSAALDVPCPGIKLGTTRNPTIATTATPPTMAGINHDLDADCASTLAAGAAAFGAAGVALGAGAAFGVGAGAAELETSLPLELSRRARSAACCAA
jgi:hypothetical protein